MITDNFFDDLDKTKKLIDASNIKTYEPGEGQGWQGLRTKDLDDGHSDVKEHIIETIEKKFNLDRKDFKKIDVFLHNRKDLKVNIHQDESDLNVLVFFDGDFNIYNGTGFYNKTPEAEILDLSVGFKENRAICFDPKIPHASLTGLSPDHSSYRWTINTFLYKEAA